MIGSDFASANVDGITIVRGDWSYTNLRNANLSKQSLRGVVFVEADLSQCKLEKADLRDADLTRARLGNALLKGADLRGAVLGGIDFKSLDMKDVRIDAIQAVDFARSYGAKIQ